MFVGFFYLVHQRRKTQNGSAPSFHRFLGQENIIDANQQNQSSLRQFCSGITLKLAYSEASFLFRFFKSGTARVA